MRRRGTDAPCRECPYAAGGRLLPANAAVAGLWLQVQGQWRTGFGGPTGLDWPAVERIAALLRVPVTTRLWQQMHALEQTELTLLMERQEKKQHGSQRVHHPDSEG